jgi:hypothetical protein
MADSFPPALGPAEWATILATRDQLDDLREGLLDTPFSPHGIAALMLYDQPFGFTRQDVIDEEEVAVYCERMEREHEAAGNREIAATFRSLGPRHRDRAARIAALLPPPSAPASPATDGESSGPPTA